MCGAQKEAASTRFAEVPRPATRRAPLMQRGAPWIRGAEWVPTAAPRPERARGISERGTWPRVRPGPKSVRSQALGRASGFPASGRPRAPQGTPGDALDGGCPGGRSAETGLGEQGRKARMRIPKRARQTAVSPSTARSGHSRPRGGAVFPVLSCLKDAADPLSLGTHVRAFWILKMLFLTSYSWRSRWSCVTRGPTPAEPLCRAPGDEPLPARRTSRLFS